MVFDVLEGVDHVDLAFEDADRAFVDVDVVIKLAISFDEGLPSFDGEFDGEAITADRDHADFDGWDVFHFGAPFYFLN